MSRKLDDGFGDFGWNLLAHQLSLKDDTKFHGIDRTATCLKKGWSCQRACGPGGREDTDLNAAYRWVQQLLVGQLLEVIRDADLLPISSLELDLRCTNSRQLFDGLGPVFPGWRVDGDPHICEESLQFDSGPVVELQHVVPLRL